MAEEDLAGLVVVVLVVAGVVGLDLLDLGDLRVGEAGGVVLGFEGFQFDAFVDEFEVAVALGLGFGAVLGVELGAVEAGEGVEDAGVELRVGGGVEGLLLEE